MNAPFAGRAAEAHRDEREADRGGVGEHVPGVRDQREGAGEGPDDDLDGHEADDQRERDAEVAPVGVPADAVAVARMRAAARVVAVGRRSLSPVDGFAPAGHAGDLRRRRTRPRRRSPGRHPRGRSRRGAAPGRRARTGPAGPAARRRPGRSPAGTSGGCWCSPGSARATPRGRRGSRGRRAAPAGCGSASDRPGPALRGQGRHGGRCRRGPHCQRYSRAVPVRPGSDALPAPVDPVERGPGRAGRTRRRGRPTGAGPSAGRVGPAAPDSNVGP